MLRRGVLWWLLAVRVLLMLGEGGWLLLLVLLWGCWKGLG